MSDNLKEIKGLVETVNSGLADLKSDQDSIKGKVDALDELKLDRQIEEITAKMDKIQEVERKQEALESAMERVSQDAEKSDETPEIVQKSKEAFQEYLRTGDTRAIKDAGFNHGDEGVEIRSLQTAIDTDGGYLVRPELADFVINRVFETSPIRQVARVVNTGSKSIEVLLDDDEAAANWTAEGSASSNTDTPDLGQKEITAHKLDAEPRATVEMIQDGYLDVEAWLQGKIADKFSRTENTAFVSGNGVGKPRGFTDYAAWDSAGVYESGKLEQIASGATSTITANGLIALQNSLKEPYQARATFLMKRASFGEILKLKGNDNYFFSPVLLRDGQAQMQLLGKRVLFADDMPAIGAGAEAIAYGDFSVGYTVVDRVGMQVLRDPYSTKGFITYYASKRVGGDVTNFDAIKLQTIST